jgi:fucose permease
VHASFERPRAAATGAALGFLLIGWSSLLVPSLIREIQRDFDQTDAGLGVFFLIHAATYATGSIGGGALTERIARRPVLVGGAVLMVIGLVGLGTVPTWPLFLLAAVALGLGTGTLDGGGNGLVLDLFSTARGRAMNLLHLFFSLGALASPLAVGLLVEAGLPWQFVLLGTGLAAAAVALLFGLVAMPSGRRAPRGTAAPVRLVRDPILIALGIAIACYVAAEVGVSNWLVRFLEAAPLAVATGALSLFWVGLTLGRIAAARFADRFDHVRLAIVASLVAATALVGAIVAPSVVVAIALFSLAGFAFGPVFPLIMAIGGDRFPGRSAAVSGLLAGVAVVGSVAYPPIMGFVSVGVGLSAAMLGTAVLTMASAAALVVAGRRAQAWAVSG